MLRHTIPIPTEFLDNTRTLSDMDEVTSLRSLSENGERCYCLGGTRYFIVAPEIAGKEPRRTAVYRCLSHKGAVKWRQRGPMFMLGEKPRFAENYECTLPVSSKRRRYGDTNCSRCEVIRTAVTKDQQKVANDIQSCTLIWYITMRCPNSCPYCCQERPGVEQLQTTDFMNLVRTLADELNPATMTVTLVGGEPIIVPRVGEIIREICGLYPKMFVRITTSMPIGTEQLARILDDIGEDTNVVFTISVHPTGQAFNENNLLECAKMVHDAGKLQYAGIVDHYTNQPFISFYTQWFADLGVEFNVWEMNQYYDEEQQLARRHAEGVATTIESIRLKGREFIKL